jgi:hypothetical protein
LPVPVWRAKKTRLAKVGNPSPAPPVQPALRGDHVALTAAPCTSWRESAKHRAGANAGKRLDGASVKAGAGAAISLVGRFAVMSGLCVGKGRQIGLTHIYVCDVQTPRAAVPGGDLLPPLRVVGEGWGGVKQLAMRFNHAASSDNPTPALPCTQGREWSDIPTGRPLVPIGPPPSRHRVIHIYACLTPHDRPLLTSHLS